MKFNEKDSLGSRMKEYEAEYSFTISKNEYFIIRLDGHNFSKFTKIFNYPYDELFRNAMVTTCMQLMDEFNPVFAYTQSFANGTVLIAASIFSTVCITFTDASRLGVVGLTTLSFAGLNGIFVLVIFSTFFFSTFVFFFAAF